VGPKQDLIEWLCQIHPIQRAPAKFERGLYLRVGIRIPGKLGIPVGNDINNVPVSGYGRDSSEQGSEDSETAHGWEIGQALRELRRGTAISRMDEGQINQAGEGAVYWRKPL